MKAETVCFLKIRSASLHLSWDVAGISVTLATVMQEAFCQDGIQLGLIFLSQGGTPVFLGCGWGVDISGFKSYSWLHPVLFPRSDLFMLPSWRLPTSKECYQIAKLHRQIHGKPLHRHQAGPCHVATLESKIVRHIIDHNARKMGKLSSGMVSGMIFLSVDLHLAIFICPTGLNMDGYYATSPHQIA